jgi:hypothetical protein
VEYLGNGASDWILFARVGISKQNNWQKCGGNNKFAFSRKFAQKISAIFINFR